MLSRCYQKHKSKIEVYSALLSHRYHEVRAFPFGADVGVAFRDITARKLRRRCDRELEPLEFSA